MQGRNCSDVNMENTNCSPQIYLANVVADPAACSVGYVPTCI